MALEAMRSSYCLGFSTFIIADHGPSGFQLFDRRRHCPKKIHHQCEGAFKEAGGATNTYAAEALLLASLILIWEHLEELPAAIIANEEAREAAAILQFTEGSP